MTSEDKKMQLKNIGSNMTELQLGDKTILFSYSTPVAYSEKGSCYKTEKKMEQYNQQTH
jgi:hypothetical protein